MSTLIDQLILLGVGRRLPNDHFFAEGDAVSIATERQGVYDIDEEELCHQGTERFTCSVLGCQAEFESVMLFEMHYNSQHRNPCSVCKKQFPSAHLLDLHVVESHDSFFQVQAERKSMYSCFVEECNLKFPSPKERRDHCISEHKFPHDFRFDYKDSTSSKKKAKNTGNENSKQTDEPMEGEPNVNRSKRNTTGASKQSNKKVVLGKGKRGRMWHSRPQTDPSGSGEGVQFDSVTQELRENLPDDKMTE